MGACERAGLRWNETAVTEIVISQSSPAVTVVPFTQQAEALSGADWIWWWVDSQSAYGMLVQAKRLSTTGANWSFDFGYSANGASKPQRQVLEESAKALGLLPVYALYLGTGGYRGWKRCSGDHRSGRCLTCVKRSVSLMPSLLVGDARDAGSTYERSTALEDLWSPPKSAAMLIPALRKQLAPELLEFLTERQDGTRAVTRSMLDRALRARYGQFGSVATPELRPVGSHDDLGRVFVDVPADTDHWGFRYFEHLLDPLLHSPPNYVLDILHGEAVGATLGETMPENIGGAVVIAL